MNQGQYLLSSYADEIIIHPMGGINLVGFSIGGLFFGGAMEKLGIDIRIYRSGKYKSAAESISRNSMSDENRQAMQALLDALWPLYRDRIAANRSIDASLIDDYINNFDEHLATSEHAAEAALEAGVVDAIMTDEEFAAHMRGLLEEDKDRGFTRVDYQDYMQNLRSLPSPTDQSPNRIAVIVAEGVIVESKTNSSSDNVIAADELVPRIRKVLRDDSVKALVLRLNTPGGSAFASELIREELKLLKEAGKPVVVAMGDVAASGGYWIASAADRILASENTLTGSIGVIGVVPFFETALDKLGIREDSIATSELAAFTVARKPSRKIETIIQRSIDIVYDQFLELVAEGRDMSKQDVHEIAQGRVWISGQAFAHGLIDRVGSLADAISVSAELAGLDDWSEKRFEPPRPFWKELMVEVLKSLDVSVGIRPLPPYLLELDKKAREIEAMLQDPKDIYALCDSCSIRQS